MMEPHGEPFFGEDITMDENKSAPEAEKENEKVSPNKEEEIESDFFEPKSYDISLPEGDLVAIANSLADSLSRIWTFDPKETINDDIIASYGVLKLLKKINRYLPADKRMGCVAEKLLPFEGGDVYIDAVYRVDTVERGPLITVATFSYDKNIINFRMFDPAKYPNAKKLYDCLGEAVPLDDIKSIEEAMRLTKQEMEDFCSAIRIAWCTYHLV